MQKYVIQPQGKYLSNAQFNVVKNCNYKGQNQMLTFTIIQRTASATLKNELYVKSQQLNV